ncbi:unnamed protein product, partial [marine sediment metagenome]
RKIAKRKDIHFWTGFSVYARPHECVKGYFSIELGIPSELRFHKKLFDQAFQTYKDGEVCFFDESSNWLIVSWTLNRKNIKQILSQKILPNKQIKSLANRIDKAMQKLMRTKVYKHMTKSK